MIFCKTIQILDNSCSILYNIFKIDGQKHMLDFSENEHPELIAEMPGTFLGETIQSGINTIERLMSDREKQTKQAEGRTR
jgi:hypothetical protein